MIVAQLGPRALSRVCRVVIAAHLLDRDDVEAGDDFGDAADVEEVADGLVIILLGEPLR